MKGVKIHVKNGHFCKPEEAEREFTFTDKEIIPGFCDSHTHFTQLGLKKERLNLARITSREELYEVLSDWVQNHGEREIIIAEDWDESNWEESEFPTRDEINRICPKKPVILRRVCGHIAVANDEALKKIPEGWERINFKNGIMEEDVVLRLNEIFPPGDILLEKSILGAQEELFKLGITSIHDIAIPEYFKKYRELESEGKLKLKIHSFITEEYIDKLQSLEDGKRVKLAGIKIFMDGSIGAKTAALSDYTYRKGGRGLLLKEEDSLRDLIKFANRKKYQLAIHAIGDRAIGTVLKAMEVNPTDNPRRHRIEHFELATESQIKEACEKNILLSMQPNFLKWSKPGGLYENVLGPRWKKNNRFKTIINRGGKIIFGSDGMPYSPLFGIKMATTSSNPEQKLNRKESLRMYTGGGSFGSFNENRRGEIKKGMEADFTAIDGERIFKTVINGNVVYSRDKRK